MLNVFLMCFNTHQAYLVINGQVLIEMVIETSLGYIITFKQRRLSTVYL